MKRKEQKEKKTRRSNHDDFDGWMDGLLAFRSSVSPPTNKNYMQINQYNYLHDDGSMIHSFCLLFFLYSFFLGLEGRGGDPDQDAEQKRQ